MGQVIRSVTPRPSSHSLECVAHLTNIFFDNKINSIFEFGSRYGEDTCELAERYPNAIVYGFECNPKTLPEIIENVKKYKNIRLTPKAVGDRDTAVKFYPINSEKTFTTWVDGNQGASSLFQSSGKYSVENYVQDEIEVPMIRLDTFMVENNISHIDVLWMDIQGAELLALKGLNSKINTVGLIHLEVEFLEIYKGQPLKNEIFSYLKKNGFLFVGFATKGRYAADAVFINRSVVFDSVFNIINYFKIRILSQLNKGKIRIKSIHP